MEAVPGRGGIVFRLAARGVAQIGTVVFVVETIRADTRFRVGMIRTGVRKVQARQEATVDMTEVSVALYGSSVGKGVMGVVGAVAVFEERAQGQPPSARWFAVSPAGFVVWIGDSCVPRGRLVPPVSPTLTTLLLRSAVPVTVSRGA
jgi:hypothetical protein